MAVFKIYASSAGSGKTFTLTKEFLKLLLKEPDPFYFKKILAMSFTNDAAEEMKNRVIDTLREVSLNKKSVLFDLIAEEIPDVSKIELHERAKRIFSEIIHNYSDLGIKTIDSFVNQVVNSFAFDLNLSYNYKIILNPDEVISEAISNIFDKIGQVGHKSLSSLLVNFAFETADDNKNWNNLAKDLNEFIKKLNNDEAHYLQKKNSALESHDYENISKKIKKYLSETENIVIAMAEEAMDLLSKNGLSYSDFSYGSNGVIGFYFKSLNTPSLIFEKREDFPMKRQIDAYEEDNWYTAKNKKLDSSRKIDEIKEELKRIGNEILDYTKNERTKYLDLKYVSESLAKIPMIGYIQNEMDVIMQNQNAVLFSDFNNWILDVVINEPVPFIYERIGERYQHLMIDEFQDTSNAQFYNVLPLIDNALANNNFNMIVGDPKQSIYSWRGGNVKLMLDLIEKNKSSLKANRETSEFQNPQIDNVCDLSHKEVLAFNYRSKNELIHFNNSFFGHIVSTKSDARPSLATVFSDFEQKPPNDGNIGGHVQFTHIDDKDEVLDKLLNIISEIESKGFQWSDIAILCKRNKEAAEIASALKLAGYDVASANSLVLKYNAEVNLLVSVIESIQNSNDAFKLFQAQKLYNLVKQQTLNVENELEFNDLMNELCLLDLENIDFYTYIEYLIDRLNLFSNEKSAPYIYKFLDAAMDFYLNQSKDLDDFISWWHRNKDSISIVNAANNAIVVTTIHKSKGLEYENVIIPYANWRLTPKSDSIKWMDLDALEFKELFSEDQKLMAAPIKLVQNLSNTFFKEQYVKVVESFYVEQINALYVAFTRASKGLYVFFKKGNVNTVSELLKSYLDAQNLAKIENRVVISKGHHNLASKEAALADNEFELKNLPIKLISQKLKERSQFNVLDNDQKRNFGQFIHQIFEKINYIKDVEIVLNTLKKNIAEYEYLAIENHVWSVINHPELRDLYDEGNEILNEIEILGGSSKISRPDRVIITDQKVMVLDYKSGEKNKKHIQQICEYGDIIKEIGYENVELKLVYLEPLEVLNVDY